MLLGGARRDHDDRDVAVLRVGLDRLGELEAVHPRHLDVEQDHVGRLLGEHLQRVEAVLRRQHVEALAREQAARDLAHGERVVDDEDDRPRGHDRGARARDPRLGVGIERLDVRPLRELHRVDDQDDLAVAEHGRARDAGDARELRADVLDHHFLVAGHLVDVDGRPALAGTEQQHRVVAGRLRVVRAVAEEPRQVVERVAVLLPRDLAGDVVLEQRLGLGLLHLLDHRRRQRPQAPARADQHDLRDGERQRQVERERRSLAGTGAHLDAAAQRADLGAHDVHPDAAARDLRDLRRGREAGPEDALDELRVGRLGVRREEPDLQRALAHPREVDAAAVVGELDHHLVAGLAYRERDLARLRLAGRDACGAGLDAVVERVAQQVLERAREFLEDRPVELGLPADDLEVRALVELARGRAQDPVQALGQAAERDRPDREQALLHVARQARLREQRGVRVVQVLEQRLLHGRHVVHALRERSRELLEARVAVELERVEALVRLGDRAHPRLDLGFGLDLDLAHLPAQPDHAAGELEQVRLERAQLAFDARTRDRDLAGLVGQPVDQVGTHAQHRARRGLGLDRLGRRRRGGDGRGRRDRHDRGRRFGNRRRGHDLGLGGRGEGHLRLRHPRQLEVRLAGAQAVEQESDVVEVAVERLEERRRRRRQLLADRQPGLHPVRELAQPHRAGHAGAALERVQHAAQLRGGVAVLRRPAPRAELFAGLREQLAGLLEEDAEHLVLDDVAHALERIDGRRRQRDLGLGRRGRLRRDRDDRRRGR